MQTEQQRVKDLETIAVLGAACLVFFALFGDVIFLWLAFALLAGGVLSKRFASAVAAGWLRFGEAFGGLVNRILLGLAFYLVLTPTALLYRFFHKDALSLSRKPSEPSYFKTRKHSFSAQDLRDPW